MKLLRFTVKDIILSRMCESAIWKIDTNTWQVIRYALWEQVNNQVELMVCDRVKEIL